MDKKTKHKPAKPFLKWAGGKTRLLKQLENFYPSELRQGHIKRYIEPFLGSAAVFFYIVQKYNIKSAYLADRNEELILTYKTVQNNVADLCESLEILSNKYYKLSQGQQEQFFYEVRESFNKTSHNLSIKRAAQVIFLNKTCYNGLFRVNKKGQFNTPFGKYLNPQLFDYANLMNVSKILQIAEIETYDFMESTRKANDKTFIYLDPPYRPISQTSSFTAYSKYEFGETQQAQLAQVLRQLNKQTSAKLMLSNSDPTNNNTEDKYFEKLYCRFHIYRLLANRAINSKKDKRGKIRELLILNYDANCDSKQLKLFPQQI